MEQSGPSPISPTSETQLNSDNRSSAISQLQDADKELSANLQLPLDEEKQVVEKVMRSRSYQLPIPVDSEPSAHSPTIPVREADKEVLSSWQTKTQEESGAIPLAYHESQLPLGELMTDVKGPPPSYDSLSPRQRTTSDDLVNSPSTLQPDGSSTLPPRPEDRSAVGQLLSWIPPAPRIIITRMPPLAQPVIIPQLDVPPEGESVPFERCYSDALAAHDVPIREFTAFLDGLAVAQAPNSALQGLKMFGVGVSSVPFPFIPLAGKGIKALASSGSGHSGSRARLYIERARKEYFEPRGLRLTIMKDKDLNPRLQIPSHAYRLAPLTKNTLTNKLSERRLEGLAPYVAPLRYDVPEQDNQIKGVHKLARKHLEQRFQGDAKRVAKLREKQWHDIAFSDGQYGVWDGRYATKLSELRQTQLDLIRVTSQAGSSGHSPAVLKEALDALWKDQRELQLLVSQREMGLHSLPGRSEGVEAEMNEENRCRGLKWILIENLQ